MAVNRLCIKVRIMYSNTGVEPQYVMNNISLEEVVEIKDLGVYYDSLLPFESANRPIIVSESRMLAVTTSFVGRLLTNFCTAMTLTRQELMTRIVFSALLSLLTLQTR